MKERKTDMARSSLPPKFGVAWADHSSDQSILFPACNRRTTHFALPVSERAVMGCSFLTIEVGWPSISHELHWCKHDVEICFAARFRPGWYAQLVTRATNTGKRFLPPFQIFPKRFGSRRIYPLPWLNQTFCHNISALRCAYGPQLLLQSLPTSKEGNTRRRASAVFHSALIQLSEDVSFFLSGCRGSHFTRLSGQDLSSEFRDVRKETCDQGEPSIQTTGFCFLSHKFATQSLRWRSRAWSHSFLKTTIIHCKKRVRT